MVLNDGLKGDADSKFFTGDVTYRVLGKYAYHGASALKQKRFRTDEKSVMEYVSFSLRTQILPMSKSSVGFFPRNIFLSSTDSLYMHFLTLLPRSARAAAVLTWDVMSRLRFDFSYDLDVDILNTEEKSRLDYRLLFTDSVKSRIDFFRERGFSIGRLDAETMPQRMLNAGLRMEHFNVARSREQTDVRIILLYERLANLKTLNWEKKHSDMWCVSYTAYMEEEPAKEGGYPLTFLNGLDSRVSHYRDHFGLRNSTAEPFSVMDPLRRIIASDIALRSQVTPEHVVDTLSRFGVDDANDLNVGYVILARMGFTDRNVVRILDVMFGSGLTTVELKTGEVFTDDTMSMFKMYDKMTLKDFSMKTGTRGSLTAELYISCMQRMLFSMKPGSTCRLRSAKRNDLAGIDVSSMRKTVRRMFAPNFSSALSNDNRNKAGLTAALLKDYASSFGYDAR